MYIFCFYDSYKTIYCVLNLNFVVVHCHYQICSFCLNISYLFEFHDFVFPLQSNLLQDIQEQQLIHLIFRWNKFLGKLQLVLVQLLRGRFHIAILHFPVFFLLYSGYSIDSSKCKTSGLFSEESNSFLFLVHFSLGSLTLRSS